ncbi:hypothetical protein CCMA1212_009377, partial [Trichoderma ghanense]
RQSQRKRFQLQAAALALNRCQAPGQGTAADSSRYRRVPGLASLFSQYQATDCSRPRLSPYSRFNTQRFSSPHDDSPIDRRSWTGLRPLGPDQTRARRPSSQLANVNHLNCASSLVAAQHHSFPFPPLSRRPDSSPLEDDFLVSGKLSLAVHGPLCHCPALVQQRYGFSIRSCSRPACAINQGPCQALCTTVLLITLFYFSFLSRPHLPLRRPPLHMFKMLTSIR